MSIAILIAVLLIGYILFYFEQKGKILDRAKSHGVIVQGVHYKVYKILRSSSYTDGGVYIKHHNVKYFGEVLLVSPEGEKLYISESHLKHCLKVRNHKNYKKEVNGRMTSRWAEWKIDPYGDDENGFRNNDIYSWLY